MEKNFNRILRGYQLFREKYACGDSSVMGSLAYHGQKPEIMVVSCCDSRVDPAVILQCDPGDLFVVRNVANIIPPYEKDEGHHGTSAALEFGICFLKVKHLILLGHSQCGGIQSLLNHEDSHNNDFITPWVSLIQQSDPHFQNENDYAKLALQSSYQNCLNFPWIAEKIAGKTLQIHLWFFDIRSGQIFRYSETEKTYLPLDDLKELQ